MRRPHRDERGFTLIELAVVVVILGLVVGFGVPGYLRFNETLQLKGAAQSIAGQIQLARQKAIASGTPQIMHLYSGTYGCDYHMHNAGQAPLVLGSLPKRVHYYWGAGTLVGQNLTLQADGRASQSGYVILQDSHGNGDTISVMGSGLVLEQ